MRNLSMCFQTDDAGWMTSAVFYCFTDLEGSMTFPRQGAAADKSSLLSRPAC